MSKIIRLDQSIQSLCSQYPELIGVMDELGFHDIVKPGMLQTAGRFMTLPKGAGMRKIELSTIIQKLEEKGFSVG